MQSKKPKKKPEFKKLIVSIVIGFVAVAFIGSFAYNYAARRGKPNYIAIVNGEPIPLGSDSLFANLYRRFYEEERQKNPEKEITEDQNLQLLRRALDAAIQRTLILQYAKKEGLKIARETVLSRIIEKGYFASPEKNFDEERFANTPEADKKQIFKAEKEQLTIELFMDEYFNTVITSEEETKSFYQLVDYGKKIEYIYLRYDDISKEKLKKFYEENPTLFEQAHVAHILIKEDRSKAEKILEEVKKNPDRFEEIAKEESEDTTAKKGGDLGWFYRNDMVAEFSEVAFKLKKGEISGIVETPFGYHILKALDNVKIKPFEDALPRIKREYVNTYQEEVEKQVAEKSKNILEAINRAPEKFDEIAKVYNLKPIRTDYITLGGQYILNEEQNTPLFELMGNKKLIELVFSTKINGIGGPIKVTNGEIIFKVIEDKKFDPENYKKAKDYVTRVYTNLKQNNLFNDWYVHTRNNSKIVDNFNKFFYKEPTKKAQ